MIVLFLAINVCLNVVYLPGSPFHVAEADNCFYTTQNPLLNGTNPLIDGNENLANLGITNSSTLREQASYPTNSTWIGNITDGLGNTFNSIYESGEQIFKYGEMMRAIILGGFIDQVIDNIALNCYFDEDGVLTQGAETAFWENLKFGLNAIVLFLLVLTVWYHLSGKGHLLTN